MRRDPAEYFINGLMLTFVLFLVYSFIFLAVHVSNEVECLEKGYPVTRTTWKLEGYCVNIDGAVMGIVEGLE